MKNNPKIKVANTRYKVISHYKEVVDKFLSLGFYSTKADLFEDLGNHAGISPASTRQMYYQDSSPSFIVAHKIAEFLDKDVSDIWEIIELEEAVDRPKCIIDNCTRIATVKKSLCAKHMYLSAKVKDGELIKSHNFR